jgi:hypothetical protein
MLDLFAQRLYTGFFRLWIMEVHPQDSFYHSIIFCPIILEDLFFGP